MGRMTLEAQLAIQEDRIRRALYQDVRVSVPVAPKPKKVTRIEDGPRRGRPVVAKTYADEQLVMDFTRVKVEREKNRQRCLAYQAMKRQAGGAA